MSSKETEKYRTRDISMAAFFMTQGLDVAETDQKGRTVWFLFEKEGAEEAEKQFLNNKDVPIQDYLQSVHTLRTMAFQGANNG